MDPVRLTLIVTGIAAGAGLVQASVQGVLAGRAARVSGRQQAVQAEIALLIRLQEQLADLAQACNDYILELHEDDFFSPQKWADLRRPVLRNLTDCHGRLVSTANALEPSSTRDTVLEAAEVAIDIGTHETPKGKADEISAAWSRDSPKILEAVSAIGAAMREQYFLLQEVTRNGPSQLIRRGLRKLRAKIRVDREKKALSAVAETTDS